MTNVAFSKEYLEALGLFQHKYPAYESTRILDELRSSEYDRLDAGQHIYLDFTGGGLYARSQLRKHMVILEKGVFGNPHSSNPSSMTSTDYVDRARMAVLDYFNASADDYAVIFTQNASGALKLVGESFPFSGDSHFLLTFDNHNSVNGIREFARAHGAEITYVPIVLPDMRLDETTLAINLDKAQSGKSNLFAFPAQSNFSGVQHPLEWIERAREKGWTVILDAAAFVPTNRLDLKLWQPDFVPISFYKMFGYPTGVGCLLARKSALAKLRRPWFAGGTITVASVQGDKYYLAPGEAAFEEGTLNYLSLPAIEIGLKYIQSIGVDIIHERVSCLTGWLLDNLLALRYKNGRSPIRLYCPCDTVRRGGTISMNFIKEDGQPFDHRFVEALANESNISLRTGCFCNPGAGEIALEITKPELMACFVQTSERLTLDEFRVCIDDKSTGAVRISTGIASNFADVFCFLQFVKNMINSESPN